MDPRFGSMRFSILPHSAYLKLEPEYLDVIGTRTPVLHTHPSFPLFHMATSGPAATIVSCCFADITWA